MVCGTPRKGREEGGVPPLVAKMQQNHPSARFGVLTVGRSGVCRLGFVVIHARSSPDLGRGLADNGWLSQVWSLDVQGRGAGTVGWSGGLSRSQVAMFWLCPMWQEAKFLVAPLRANPVTGAVPHDLI